MSAIADSPLPRVNVSEVAVLQPSYVKVENV